MTDDYLWNRQGEPDPEVEELEALLSPLKRDLPPLELPPDPRRRGASRLAFRPLPVLAAAASVLMAALGAWWVLRSPVPSPAVEASRLDGAPTVDGAEVRDPVRITEGNLLETLDADRALIQMRGVGQIEVEERSALRLLRARSGEHRFELQRGVIHATIWAPAREFFVETAAAVAVDLGCAYTLEAPGPGSGRLSVTSGLVGLERGSRLVYVPAGASCSLSASAGPGIPVFDDAGPDYADAVLTLESETADLQNRLEALDVLLGRARPRDSLTLWHLLPRTAPEETRAVYDALAQLVAPPAGVTIETVLAGNQDGLELWWRQIQSGPLRRTNRR